MKSHLVEKPEEDLNASQLIEKYLIDAEQIYNMAP
jgi:hypothetical protein